MEYGVAWNPAAEARLAEIWMAAADKQAVADGADQIESLLARTPLDVGESRTGNERILAVSPLCVRYDVWPDDMRVKVHNVWRF
jgi:hypothetical protein